MTFARLTAVYGLPFSDLWYRMPLASIKVYIEHIPHILAERKVMLGNAALLPRIADPDAISEIMDGWLEEAFGEVRRNEPATPGMLKLMGIGVEHVGKSQSW